MRCDHVRPATFISPVPPRVPDKLSISGQVATDPVLTGPEWVGYSLNLDNVSHTHQHSVTSQFRLFGLHETLFRAKTLFVLRGFENESLGFRWATCWKHPGLWAFQQSAINGCQDVRIVPVHVPVLTPATVFEFYTRIHQSETCLMPPAPGSGCSLTFALFCIVSSG